MKLGCRWDSDIRNPLYHQVLIPVDILSGVEPELRAHLLRETSVEQACADRERARRIARAYRQLRNVVVRPAERLKELPGGRREVDHLRPRYSGSPIFCTSPANRGSGRRLAKGR